MNTHEPAQVLSAFKMLLDAIEADIAFTNDAGAHAFAVDDHSAASDALEHTKALHNIRSKVLTLHHEWLALYPTLDPDQSEHAGLESGRLPPGQGTPRSAYILPTLRVLHHLGGTAKAGDLYSEVFRAMSPTLKDADNAPIPSDESTPRWRKTLSWARFDLVQKGFIKPDSPHGLWEITPKGIAYLQRHPT